MSRDHFFFKKMEVSVSSSTMEQGDCDSVKKRNLKEDAIAFYTEHNVTEVLETLLNTMFLDSPQDMYGYMSEFFHSLSKDPVISIIKGWELFDSNGDPSLSLTLHCVINGIDKLVCSYVHILTKHCRAVKEDSSIKDNPDSDSNDSEHQTSLSPLESVNKMSELLHNMCLKDQLKINGFITQDVDPLLHPSSQCAVSRISALSLSKLSDEPLFLSLNKSFERDNHLMKCFTPPLPLVAVLVSGMSKLKIRGFYLMPSPLIPLSTGIESLIDIYRELGRSLATKQGPAAISSNGAFYLTSDKPEVILELLKDTCLAVGLELNKDVMIVIDVGSEEMYDEDKKKYEFSVGQWKTGDELISILSNLVTGFPGLVGFIDPFHFKDINSWNILREQVGTTCLLIADRTLSDLPLREDKVTASDESDNAVNTNVSCVSLSNAHSQTLRKCFDEASELRGVCTYFMFSTKQNHTPSSLSFDVDLATALHCKFIKVDAPIKTTSSVVFSRLKEIEGLLESFGLQLPSSALIFYCES